MVTLENRNKKNNFRNDNWNRIICEHDAIIINEVDDLVVDFVKDATQNIVHDYLENLKGWWKDNENAIKQQTLSTLRSTKNNYFNEIYQYLWKTRKNPLLLEVGDSQTAKQVQDILKLSQGIFRVIVLNQSDKVINRLSDLKVFVNIGDLSKTNREIILLHPVILQGRLSTVPLKDVTDSVNSKYVTTKDVIYILCDKFIIGNKSEPLPKFFEEMSLARVWLNISVLLEIRRDVFIVKCFNLDKFNIYLHNYSEKARNLLISSWRDVKSTADPKIITYKDEKDLWAIENHCSEKGKQFHVLIFYDTDNLAWVKSSGLVSSIKSFRLDSKINMMPLATKDLIADIFTNRKSVLVCSNPGMGKSVLINCIAQNVPSNWWVLKINLAEYREVYNNWDVSNPSSQLFCSFVNIILAHKKCNNVLQETVLRLYLKNKSVIFLMDGFDEIPVSYQNGAKKLVKFMHHSGYLMCITTRPVLKLELESILNTFAFPLNLFTRTNQENFLNNYFSAATNLPTDERVQLFVKQLLDRTEKNLNDRDHSFAGVPLQTMLLAQVFVGDCIKYLQTASFETKHFDLLYLYRHFFKKKLEIARAKVEGVSEDSIIQYKVCRSFYALRVIFPESILKPLQIDEKLKNASYLFPLMIQLIQKDGVIVAEEENDVTFIHRTFAEYLVAEWLAENINGNDKEIVTNLVIEVFDPNFEVVRNIFDRILAEGCHLHLAIINRQIDKVENIINSNANFYNERDKGNRTFVHLVSCWGQHHPLEEPTNADLITLRRLAANDDMKQILKLIPRRELTKSNNDDILNYTPLDYAIISGSLNIANGICARLKNSYHFELLKTLNNRVTYIYKMNYYSLQNAFVRFGFSCVNLKQNINHKEGTHRSLYYAIKSGHIHDVLPLILDQSYINCADIDTGYTHLHIAVLYCHIEAASLLLSHKANPNTRDNIGRIPLHWALSKKSENDHLIEQSYIYDVDIDKKLETTKTDKMHTMDIEHKKLEYSNKYINSGDTTTIFVEILSRDKYIDVADNDGNSPLILAAYFGHTNAINILLARGADVEAKNKRGDTALTVSASNGQTDIVSVVLYHGADKEVKNGYGYTALLAAAIYGQAEMVKLLLSKGSDKEAKCNGGATSLMLAASGGHNEIVRLLLSQGSDINAKANNNDTALVMATYNGHMDTVDVLLLHGADMEVKRHDGLTAFLMAAHNGLSDIAHLLLCRGANQEARSNYGHTALTIAAQYGHTDVVNLLLSYDLDKEAKILHCTALALAAQCGHTNTVDVLLSRNCNKEAKCAEGHTPLIRAAANGHTDIVNLLLSEGVDNEVRNVFGLTALAWASGNGHIEVVKLLLSHGSDKEARNNDMATPLILAAKSGHIDVVNLLLSHGADKEAKTMEEATALILAATYGHADVVNLLLSKGADKEAKTNFGVTALLAASFNGHIDIVNLLLSRGADKEAKTVVNVLLSFGCRTDQETISGKNALSQAMRNGYVDIMELISTHGCDNDAKSNSNFNGGWVLSSRRRRR